MSESRRTYFLEQVLSCTSICSSPADLKIVVVPEIAAATALRGALAKQGPGLVNIEIVTPSGLTKHIWRAVHPERSFKFIHKTEAEFILGTLADELDSPFRSLFSSSISHIYRSLIEDRLMSRKTDESELSGGSEVQRAIYNLRLQYESFLQENDRLDEVDVLFQASESTTEFLEQRQLELLLVDELLLLNRQEKTLINRLKTTVRHAFVLGSGLISSTFDQSWERAGLPTQSTSLKKPQVLISSTRREEVRVAISDVLNRGVPFDQIEFVCTDYPSYLTEIASSLERFNIPWQTSVRRPTLERDVQLCLIGFAEWCTSGFDVTVLVRMIRENTLDVSVFERAPRELVQALEAFPISVHLYSDASTWDYVLERAQNRGIKRSSVMAWKKFGKALLPTLLPNKCSFTDFKKAFIEFATLFTSFELTQQSMDDFWASQFSFSDQSSRLVSTRTWIAQQVRSRMSNPIIHHETGISVLPLTQSGYGSAQLVYVFGMDDQAASDSGDLMAPLPSDLAPSIPSLFEGSGKFEGTGEFESGKIPKRKLVKELHRRYGQQLVLCTPTYDVASDRPLFASSAFIELTGLATLVSNRRVSGLDLADNLATQSFSQQGRQVDHVSDLIFNAYQPLKQGQFAIEQRASSAWTEYDGMLSVPPDWKLNRVSPSGLEGLAQCPFRFFLNRILRLSAPETNTDTWLTPKEEGTLVHDVFERFVRARINKSAQISESSVEDLVAELQADLDRYSALSDGKVDAQVKRKLNMLRMTVALFIARENRLQLQRVPYAVEYAFGEQEKADAPSFVLEIDGGEVNITGRLDRLDQNKDGSFVITDYKTGRFEGYNPHELKQLKDHLQWAIYSLAMSAHLDGAVESFEYFFPSPRGGGIVRRVATPDLSEFQPVLERLVKTYNRGGFLQAPKENACTYCEFKTVCGDLDERKEELKQKFWAEPHLQSETPSEQETASKSETWSSILQGWSFRSKMGEPTN